ASVFAEITPGGEMIMNARGAQNAAIGSLRRRSVPHVPVHAFRSLLGGQIARFGRRADTDAYRPHAPDASAAHILDGLAKVAVELGSLLAARLKDDVVLARRPHHGP